MTTPEYVILSRLTADGRKTLRSNPERLLEVNEEIDAMGAKVMRQYALLGKYDFLTILERLGQLKDVRLTYLGDGNNVLHSLLIGGAMLGMHIVAATPVDYRPLPGVVQKAEALARSSGGSVTLTADPIEAVREAHVLYTDTWTSMGQEEEAAARRQVFPAYQINDALLARGAAIEGVMHCLPAHRGEEITDAVADGERSWLWDQAENRLHGQKAILVHLLKE